jgi:hypothetical protein
VQDCSNKFEYDVSLKWAVNQKARTDAVQELIAELKQSIAAATTKVDELRGLL